MNVAGDFILYHIIEQQYVYVCICDLLMVNSVKPKWPVSNLQAVKALCCWFLISTFSM